jgi:hypothetical protein
MDLRFFTAHSMGQASSVIRGATISWSKKGHFDQRNIYPHEKLAEHLIKKA